MGIILKPLLYWDFGGLGGLMPVTSLCCILSWSNATVRAWCKRSYNQCLLLSGWFFLIAPGLILFFCLCVCDLCLHFLPHPTGDIENLFHLFRSRLLCDWNQNTFTVELTFHWLLSTDKWHQEVQTQSKLIFKGFKRSERRYMPSYHAHVQQTYTVIWSPRNNKATTCQKSVNCIGDVQRYGSCTEHVEHAEEPSRVRSPPWVVLVLQTGSDSILIVKLIAIVAGSILCCNITTSIVSFI